MGVDPGTTIMGYGVLKTQGQKVTLLHYDVIHLSKYKGHHLKLKHIFENTLSLVKQYLPDEMAVEAPFFGKNVQSMLKLGRAQGVIMAAAMYRDIPVEEYSPRKIKQSITGNGNASKEQVAGMIAQTIGVDLEAKYLDATDGIAAALCHHYQAQLPGSGKGAGNSWKQFLKNHPDRRG